VAGRDLPLSPASSRITLLPPAPLRRRVTSRRTWSRYRGGSTGADYPEFRKRVLREKDEGTSLRQGDALLARGSRRLRDRGGKLAFHEYVTRLRTRTRVHHPTPTVHRECECTSRSPSCTERARLSERKGRLFPRRSANRTAILRNFADRSGWNPGIPDKVGGFKARRRERALLASSRIIHARLRERR